ncbi:hypothetical protein K504DRAFT_104542 [Pleomassaria siparia CBS 279.74]|uniref:Uncharacterized protein n=1 Tax=Pleomassaria siparia CBS 279.74 TaxID=1314801 RepID=A0A6G1JWV5_9PLEO|nr:hypothetical protein K504DRAFT_104542 [Pleomassaria siparia CBS 279.74]
MYTYGVHMYVQYVCMYVCTYHAPCTMYHVPCTAPCTMHHAPPPPPPPPPPPLLLLGAWCLLVLVLWLCCRNASNDLLCGHAAHPSPHLTSPHRTFLYMSGGPCASARGHGPPSAEYLPQPTVQPARSAVIALLPLHRALLSKSYRVHHIALVHAPTHTHTQHVLLPRHRLINPTSPSLTSNGSVDRDHHHDHHHHHHHNYNYNHASTRLSLNLI